VRHYLTYCLSPTICVAGGGLLTSRLSNTGDGTLSRPQSAGGQSTGGHSSSGTGGGGSGGTLQVQALHLDVVTCAVNPDIVLRQVKCDIQGYYHAAAQLIGMIKTQQTTDCYIRLYNHMSIMEAHHLRRGQHELTCH
jgi:hypothetical protein